jgi:hypothetical protein
VERVDSEPRYGEVPGTPAYEKRGQDAVPDEIEVVPEGSRSRRMSMVEEPGIPGGNLVPRTVVEKVDPTSPSHGEVPGTEAYQLRKADALPDIVVKRDSEQLTAEKAAAAEHNLPETLLSRVDSLPDGDSSLPRPRAHRRSPSDALPDATETLQDTPGKLNIYLSHRTSGDE